MNPYKLLGLTSSATQQEIRSAYLAKAKELHPDSPTGSATKFKDLHEAYLSLKFSKSTNTHSSPDLNFTNIIKAYTRPHRPPNPAPPSPTSTSKLTVSKSPYIQSLLLVSLFLYLWSLNTQSDLSTSFQAQYLKNCNKISYAHYPEAISNTKNLSLNPNTYT